MKATKLGKAVLMCLIALGLATSACGRKESTTTPPTGSKDSATTPAAAGKETAGEESAEFARYGQEFKGKIARTYEESQEWYPETKRPKPGTPNVLIILLDDVGFAQYGSFGGLIKTPNIDALAADGLRYNNFHTTALCSPSRAALMAGRNTHKIGLGSHAVTP